jgi:hypothetical protein
LKNGSGWFARLRWRFQDPVFVVSGLPRSGTSMAVKMLEAGGVKPFTDSLRRPDVDNPKGYFEYEPVKDLAKATDKRWVRRCRGRVVKVISFLLADLPRDCRYKVLFMLRDLDEVVASQNKMLERRGEALRQDDDEVKRMFREHLERTGRWLRRQPNFEVLELRYPEVIRSPETSAERIREFLKLDLDVRRMAEAVDPELYRNRA